MTFKLIRSPFVGSSKTRSGRPSFYRTQRTVPSYKGKSSNIKVCVRIRPLNEAEKQNDAKLIVRPLDETVLVFDPYEPPPEKYYKGRLVKDIGIRRNKDLKMAFDCVFDSESTNGEVFESTTKKMLDYLMEGVNCSIFAYGATGAGKTHTMLGTFECPGVISRTMNELYARMEAVKDDLICSVEVSYLEIYNETVRDLMNPQAGVLAVREDGGSCISIAGLTLYKPDCAEHLFRMLDDGNKNRTQHPTDANKESSRSHAVFQVYLKQSPKTADLSTDVLISKMVLVDLAGSERATATRNCGKRMREGANINRSLLALGNCINALAEGKKGAHIPYRDSKLTRILKDALGGNCHTVMIANVSPSVASYDDTQNTLKYADRAKHIKADLRKNIFRVDQHIHQYGKIVQELHAEVDDLKTKYKQAQVTIADLEAKLKQKEEIERLDERASRAEGRRQISSVIPEEIRLRVSEYITIQDRILAYESQKKLLKKKLESRERVQNYLNLIDFDPDRHEQDLSRTNRIRNQYEAKMQKMDTSINELKFNLNDIKRCLSESLKLADLQDEMSRQTLSDLLGSTRLCQLENSNQHLSSLLKGERQKFQHFDKIVSAFCALTREQHLILSSYDRLTTSLKCKFEDLIEMLQSNKDITWMDDEPRRDSTGKQGLRDYVLHLSPLRQGMTQNLATKSLHVENFYSSDDNSDKENSADDSSASKHTLNRTFTAVNDGFCATPSSSSNSSRSQDSMQKCCSSSSSLLEPKMFIEQAPQFPTLSFESGSVPPDRTVLKSIENRLSPLVDRLDRSPSNTVGQMAQHGESNANRFVAINGAGRTMGRGDRKSPNNATHCVTKNKPTNNFNHSLAKTVVSPPTLIKQPPTAMTSSSLNATFVRSTSSLPPRAASTIIDDDAVFKRPAPPPPPFPRNRPAAPLASAQPPWRPRPLTGKSPTGINVNASRAGQLCRSPSSSSINVKAADSSAFKMKKTCSTTSLWR